MSPTDIAFVTDQPRIAALAHETFGDPDFDLSVYASDRVDSTTDLSDHVAVFVDLAAGEHRLASVAARHAWTIAIGGSGSRDDLLMCLRAGARDHVSTIDTDELRAALARAGGGVPSTPSPHVEILGDDSSRTEVRLDGEKMWTIGRDLTNEIVLATPVVSRFHASIAKDRGEYWVSDRESRHGVYVNDERIESPRRLRSGDRIRLGKPNAPTVVFVDPTQATAATPTAGWIATHAVPPADSSTREFKDLASLLDTFLQLNTDLVLDDLLRLVLSRSIELANAERGMILLLDEPASRGEIRSGARTDRVGTVVGSFDGRALRLALALNRHGSEVGTEDLRGSQKLPTRVLESGRGLMVEDFLSDEASQDHRSTIEMGLRSAMCVPLRGGRSVQTESTPIGVLYVDSRSRSRPFSDPLLIALESLAREAAAAILNARLYQVSLEKRQIDKEMALAREIQSNLLPPERYQNRWLELSGSSEPSLEVGGDLLDYVPGDSRVGLLVGDVSGKGVSAALFSAMVDGHFHAFSGLPATHAELGTFASGLNRYLERKSGLQKFVTLFFGVLESNGRFSFVNAGHVPPLLVRPSAEVFRLKTGGMVLGMFAEASFESASIEVLPGDVIALCSDGITEARDPEGQFFGDTRLESIVVACRHLGAHEIRLRILEELARFSKGAKQTDDVTLLVAKVIGP